VRKGRGLGAAAALCLSLTGFGLLSPIPAAAADLTVQGVSAWDDPLGGIVHVVGEVLNSGAVNYQPVMVRCTLVDAAGATLIDSKSIEANILMPNEKAPFDTLFFTGAGSHSPSCSVSGAQTSFEPDHNFKAVITDVTFPADGSQHVIGTLTNNNTVDESNIRVVLTSYDPSSPGTVIDEGVAWVDGPVSANGGAATFDLNANTTRHWDTSPADSAVLSEAPSPAVVLSTDTLAFPDQVQGTVSAEQVLYVRNIGTGNLTFTDIPTFGGTNPADFGRAADDQCSGTTVGPGAACSMGITFTPQAVGARSASLTINDNANGSPGVVTLTGNGLARPSIAVGATSLEFGSQMVGTTGQTVVQLTSNGLDPASINSILVDDTSDFGVDGSACLLNDIQPGSACQISLAFHPQLDGPLSGTLTIRSDARQDPVTIPLSGTGTHAVPGAALSPTHLTFGSQTVGTTSPSQTVTLTNTGIGSLTITGITSNNGDFVVQTNGCGATLASGASCAVAVTFAPSSAGDASGTLTVTDNAGSGSQIVALTGTGSTETDFYFAEGFTGPGFQETLTLLMPNNAGTATVDYYMKDGAHTTSLVSLQEGQVRSVDVNADPNVGPNQEVSIRVKLPFPGVAERVMHFRFGAWYGSTDIVGTTTPSSEWDFAEGSTLGSFSEYLTLQNPNGVAVSATLAYMTDSGAHPSKTVSLPANSRTTVEVFKGDTISNQPSCIPNLSGSNCGVGPGIAGVSVKVTTPNGQPIVAERPFYVNGFSFGSGPINDGHVAFGANAPATQWNFAEGTTLPGFNEYLSLQNPSNASTASVTLRYTDQSGTVTTRSVSVNPLSRVTVEVWKTLHGVGPGVAGVSTTVTSTLPIVAERPMYVVRDFGSGSVAGATDVVGSTTFSTLFGFAAATTVSGENDFLTIQNPSSTTVAKVHISYYTASQTFPRDPVTVNPNTRLTVPIFSAVSGALGSGYAGVGIVILSEQPVLVEKPTYSANSDTYGATDTLGYSPPNF